MLIEEFGKDYARYFEILQLIASGYTTRGEIESIMKIELSGYLTKLENDYCLISRYTPMFQKTNRNIRYQIEDNFLRIWFRYIYKYGYMIEVGANKNLRWLWIRATPHTLARFWKDISLQNDRKRRIYPNRFLVGPKGRE